MNLFEQHKHLTTTLMNALSQTTSWANDRALSMMCETHGLTMSELERGIESDRIAMLKQVER